MKLSANSKYGDQLVTPSPGPVSYNEIRAVAADAVERRRERRRKRNFMDGVIDKSKKFFELDAKSKSEASDRKVGERRATGVTSDRGQGLR